MIVRDWDNRGLFGLSYKNDKVTGAILELEGPNAEYSFKSFSTKVARTNTQIQVCGPGRQCIPVRVSVPGAIPDVFWSWSCYEIIGCTWVEAQTMQNPPQDMLPPPPSFSNGPTPSMFDFAFQIISDRCSGTQTLYARSISTGKEQAAILTTTNKLITLPTYGNTISTSNIGPQISNLQNQLLTDMHPDASGKIVITVYNWSNNSSETHEVAATVHTHPCSNTFNQPNTFFS